MILVPMRLATISAMFAAACTATPAAPADSRASMTTTNQNLPMDRVEPVARLQVDLPDGKVTNPRRVWEQRVADVWGVTVTSPKRRSNAFVRVAGGRVTVPAGMAQAARELAAMKVLEGGSWSGGLAYVVTAAGGITPGWPDAFDAVEEARPGGGVAVTLKMPEPWVAWAAAGGVGPPPPNVPGGGVAMKPPDGTATLEIDPDYAISWRYKFAGKDVAGCAGRPAAAPPTLSDVDLISALTAARRKAGASRAMPATEPHSLSAAKPRVIVVDLCGIGEVQVDLDAPAAGP